MHFTNKNDILLMLVFESAVFARKLRRKNRLNLFDKRKLTHKTEVFNMSRVCNICGKGQASGNNVSHSNRKTRRTFKVNVQKISYVEDGKETNGYVCARCIRTLKKADAE